MTRSEKMSRHPARKVILPLKDRLNEQTIYKVVEQYKAGQSSGQIAKEFTLTKNIVLDVLREAGVSVRLPRMSDAETQEAARLYATGLSLVDVGQKLGRNHSTIYKALKRAGVRMRDTTGR